ncbi:tetratricopeptide repeat protein [Clostridium perfringens]|uniref:tetratricopeptide repeat protein n=1 Tax=Clostridium perfringens TaxID=1502 RepID=UPI0013E3CA91|nr:tetratricopeptide repeat protein [Clostridium perfringens]ELC8368925.1 tetratricopeptide repeat protein [Clostridium perfringens]MBO3393818.1 tetratricopeptide repeat protein [Clostridium perfringens]MBO3400116.1 tetratricopeptide repeat protein [Clostridium perfringens]MDK0981848.1 tetratricopeptide repeat protein [Clostridium perfringens]MDM0632168.1 tetratricopeptide repeat protein [Clostridium perfringens]
MSFNTFAKEKLSQLLFLEIDGDGFVKSLGKDPKEVNINEVYIPIDPKHLSQDVKSGYKLESLPINYLVEGMFFALGGDKDFKFNKEYKKLIPLIEDAIPCVKKIVADKVKEENMVEAFMLLKGLTEISDETEVYENLLLICESLRERNKAYNETQLEICDKCKSNRSDLALPYLYSAIAYNDMGQYDKAYVDINEYLAKGGERNEIVEVLYNEIKDSADYEEGKEDLIEEPEDALKRLLPLADKFQDNAILRYYIATAYRRLGNFEKAVYYLNECLSIDDSIVEAVNEMGINYASLGIYDEAVKYLRKAFESTRDIEVCTNLIVCYLNAGKIEEAKQHLDIAKAINKDDEIVKEIETFMKNNNIK